MTEIRTSIRCLCAAAIAGLLLAPLGVSAAPTPSPTLDTILAKPPSSDFREVPTAKLHGSFTAHDWATANAGAVSATEIETTLNFEGFVAGYSSAWIQPASGKRLTETVMAFAGGLGARNVLAALERGDKASATYKYADTLSGVDQSYGAHLVDVPNKTISDGFAFVKGNDVFVIVAVSAKDDVLALATTQAQTQFATAPDNTIPSAQWPENAFQKGGASDPGRWIAVSLILAGLFVLAGVVLAVVLGSRRAAFATANPGAMSLAAASAHPGSGVLELEAPQLHGPAAAATIAAVPAAAHRPVRIPTIHPDDLYTVGGAAVSSLCLAWLTYWQLAPEPGVLGFVLAWLGAFAAMYWLATRRILGRLFAKDRLISVVITAGAVVMLAPLLLIVSFVAYKGFSVITPHFFTETAQFCGQLDAATCGGVGHAIVGTLEQVGIATLMSVPLAVLCAVFLNEIGGPLARPVRLFVDAMSGVPSIVAGLFIYAVWVVGLQRGFSGFAASLALAILMLPTITRTAEVVLRLVPDGLREGSLALGGTEWRTTWQVVLPTARSGLITAVILGVARAVGETAPLLLTSFGSSVLNADPLNGPQEALPHYVFQYIHFNPGTGPYQRAWAAAAVLTGLVLGLFTLARVIGSMTSIEARQARAGRRRTASARAAGAKA